MNKETVKNVLIVLVVIVCLPLIYKLLTSVLHVVAFLIIVAAAYYIGWPWLKNKFGKKE